MSRTVIIDGDVLAYRVASAIQEDFEIENGQDDEFIYRTISFGNKRTAINKIEDKLSNIVNDTKSSDYVIALSDIKTNFRKIINPNYKANRKTIKPILLNYIRDYLKTNYKVYEKPSLEADDVMGILATSDKIIKGDKVIWSMDKDFKTLPCKFRREAPNGSHISKIISEEEANWWFMYQTLVGDAVDGYSGCKGIGDKTARKILCEIGEKSLEEMWEAVKNSYKKYKMTEDDALLNARMARILRAEDYDFKKKEVKIWHM